MSLNLLFSVHLLLIYSFMLTLCLVSPVAVIYHQISLIVLPTFICYSPPTVLVYLRDSAHEICVTPAGVLRPTLCDGESPLKGQTQIDVSFCRKQQLNGVWRGASQTVLVML